MYYEKEDFSYESGRKFIFENAHFVQSILKENVGNLDLVLFSGTASDFYYDRFPHDIDFYVRSGSKERVIQYLKSTDRLNFQKVIESQYDYESISFYFNDIKFELLSVDSFGNVEDFSQKMKSLERRGYYHSLNSMVGIDLLSGPKLIGPEFHIEAVKSRFGYPRLKESQTSKNLILDSLLKFLRKVSEGCYILTDYVVELVKSKLDVLGIYQNLSEGEEKQFKGKFIGCVDALHKGRINYSEDQTPYITFLKFCERFDFSKCLFSRSSLEFLYSELERVEKSEKKRDLIYSLDFRTL